MSGLVHVLSAILAHVVRCLVDKELVHHALVEVPVVGVKGGVINV